MELASGMLASVYHQLPFLALLCPALPFSSLPSFPFLFTYSPHSHSFSFLHPFFFLPFSSGWH